MALRKTDKANLRNRYSLFVEIGMVLSIGILVLAFRTDFTAEQEFEIALQEQETVQMEEITQTQHSDAPPPPPRPPVPVEVPNDVLLQNDELDLDASLDLDDPFVSRTPPPPPVVEEEELAEEEEPEIFVIVEETPVLLGGLSSIQQRINYPEIAQKANVEGRVIVQFIVDEEGNVSNAEVTRGIGAGCDEEAIRAVMQAKFNPGRQRGKAVRVRMSLPITFKLRN